MTADRKVIRLRNRKAGPEMHNSLRNDGDNGRILNQTLCWAASHDAWMKLCV